MTTPNNQKKAKIDKVYSKRNNNSSDEDMDSTSTTTTSSTSSTTTNPNSTTYNPKTSVKSGNFTIMSSSRVVSSDGIDTDELDDQDVYQRCKSSLQFKDEESLYLDIDKFEILQYNLHGGERYQATAFQPLTERSYISLDKFDSKDKVLAVGILNSRTHPLNGKLVRFLIGDYSLEYKDNKADWCCWIKTNSTKYEVWFKLKNPFKNYKALHETFHHKYLMVMYITSFIESSKLKKNMYNLNIYLKLNIPKYNAGDIEQNYYFLSHHCISLLGDESKVKKFFSSIAPRQAYVNDYQRNELGQLISSQDMTKKKDFSKRKWEEIDLLEADKKKITSMYTNSIKKNISTSKKPSHIDIGLLPENSINYIGYEPARICDGQKLPTQPLNIRSYDENDFNQDLRPYLTCRICGQGRQLLGFGKIMNNDDYNNLMGNINQPNSNSNNNSDSDDNDNDTENDNNNNQGDIHHVQVNKSVWKTFEDFLQHLHNHRMEQDRLLTYTDKINLQTRSLVNQFRIRTVVESMVENVENNNYTINNFKKKVPGHETTATSTNTTTTSKSKKIVKLRHSTPLPSTSTGAFKSLLDGTTPTNHYKKFT